MQRKPKGKIPKSTRNRTPEQDALLRRVRRYQSFMRSRIAYTNNLDAMFRTELLTPEERDEMKAEFVRGHTKVETEALKPAVKIVRTLPIYKQWLAHVRGCGDVLAAQFIALLQPISDFPNVSKLWAYCGMHTVDGQAPKRKRGERANWNPALRTLCFQLSDCFVKQGRYYRQVYDAEKARQKVKHPEPIPQKTKDGETFFQYSDGHLHNMAKRKAAKLFLAHLWGAWRELEGLTTRVPYPVEYLGHEQVISPWEVIECDAAEAVEV